MSHRMILGFPLATAITVGLFLLMQSLIQVEFTPEAEIIPDVKIKITRDLPQPPTIEGERELPEIKKPDPAPPPPQKVKDVEIGDLTRIGDGVDYDFDRGFSNGFKEPRDREVIPIVRIPPEFPIRARTGGWVLIQFDISPFGTVQNAVVIDAEPRGVFDRSALKAIQKWKYRPKLVNGKPVFQYGMEQQIMYEIEGED